MPSSAPARFAQQHGLPFLAQHDLPNTWPALEKPFDYWQQHAILPLQHNADRFTIAVAAISALRSVNDVAFDMRCQVEAYWCSPETLSEGFRRLASQQRSTYTPSISSTRDDDDILKALRQLVQHAASHAASDIHLDPALSGYSLRLRIDGRLHAMEHWPLAHGERLIRQLKLLAGLDIAQTRLPQDGALHITLDQGEHTDLRMSTLPALYGEKAVLRFIPSGQSLLKLTDIGLSKDHYHDIQHAMRQHGMIVVTGPTGSGKTSTLYRMLMALEHRTQLNVCSVEDPVEARLEGINQVQVQSAQGLGFVHILRALLRQDPDVLMVGEIRDSDTAHIAVRAAQTGHLLLSTLHTGTALETFSRLHALGIPCHDLASAITLIISQRLVRQLCSHCRRPDTAPSALLTRYPSLQKVELFQAGAGCNQCRDGFQGRIALFEVVPMTAPLRNALLSATPIADVQALLSGTAYHTLQNAALDCLAEARTSLNEVLNVIH